MSDPQDLVDRVLDGIASPAETAELHQRLIRDPEMRRVWWAETELRTRLADAAPGRRQPAHPRSPPPPRARPRVRGRVPVGLLAAVLALAVGLTLLAVMPGDRVPAPAWRIAGGTVIADGTGRDPLAGGQRHDTEDLVLDLADGSRIALPGRAGLAILRPDGAHLRLHAGRMAVRAAARPPDDPLRILTDHGAVTVLGTRFTVDAQAGSTVLQVEEGSVRIEDRHGQGRTVAAGEAAYLDAAGLARRTRIARPSATAPLAGLVAELSAGDALLLADGDYPSGLAGHPEVRATATGSAMAPMRIAALPGQRPRIVGGGWVALDIAARHLHLEGLTLVGATAGAAAGQGTGLRIQDAQAVVVVDADISGFGGAGLHIERSRDVSLRGGRIVGNGGVSPFGQGGITIHAGSRGITVAGTVIAENRLGPANLSTGTPTGGHGIFVDGLSAPDDGTGVVISGVRIVDNDGPGIAVRASVGVMVRDAQVGGNGRAPQHANRTQILLVDAAGIQVLGSRVTAGPGSRLLERHLHTEVSGSGNQWSGPDIPDGL
jgi:ferric-dicitrate binding protein FerR (iron transport regulator)